MGGKKKKRSGKSLYKGMMKAAKTLALVIPPIQAYRAYGNVADPVLIMTGYNMTTHQWEWRKLVDGWGPFVGVNLAEKAIGFVNRLIRSL